MAKICVFTGSADVKGDYAKVARDTGRLIAQRGHELIYGGTNFGLMGLVSSSAKQKDAKVTAIIPSVWIKSANKNYNTIEAKDLSERKKKMYELSDAFITLSGGFGTLDEFFKISTIKQIYHCTKPNVVVNTNGYYDPLLSMLNIIKDTGFLGKDFLNLECSSEKLYHFVSKPIDALKYIEKNI